MKSFRIFLIALFLTTMLVRQESSAQAPPPDQAPAPVLPEVSPEGKVSVQFPNTPIPTILLFYELYTGKQIVRDATVQDKTLNIQTSGKVSKEDAAVFIEKSLLLNGYALIPTNKPDELKIIAYASDKKLTSEGLRVVTSPLDLPKNDEVVTFIMPVTYLTSEDAATAFTDIVDLHPYGKVTALTNASAIVVTESATVIRHMLELQPSIDVSPVKSIDKAFYLERADAEEVAEALADILDLDVSGTSSSSSAPGTPSTPRAQERKPGAGVQAAGNVAQATTIKPKVRPIPRVNKILVVASPTDMEQIEGLIMHLDAPLETSNFIRRKLNYITVASFLPIAGDTLLRGHGGEDTQAAQISGGTDGAQANNGLSGSSGQAGGAGGLGGNSSSNSSSGFGSNRSNSTSGAGAAFGGAGQDPDIGPQSLVIDKTLLIADNTQNTLIASGPPEHLHLIEELLDVMDCKPVQIQISAVIAQLNLGDDFELGFDMLRSLDPAGNEFAGSFKGRSGTAQTLLDIQSLTDPANLLPAAQGLTVYGQVNALLDGFVSTLNNTNRFKVLSRPTVYTINNKRAVIQTGQRIAVPRSTLSSVGFDQNSNNQTVTSNIDFEDVLLRVEVLPLINNDGQITLKINQSNDNIIGSQTIGGNQIPTIGTQALGTTIMVGDGQTVLLGGLISESESKAESGLPLFANLPFVGRVFGSTVDNVSRQELLIFIQPKIINNEGEFSEVDQDMLERTRVGKPGEGFAVGTENNLESFESHDFDSPQKRINFFKNLFKKKNRDPAAPRKRRSEVEVESYSPPQTSGYVAPATDVNIDVSIPAPAPQKIRAIPTRSFEE